MAKLTTPILTTNGAYEIENLIPGKEYLLTLKGSFDGATVALTTRSIADGTTFDPVTGGSFTGDTEDSVRMPSSVLRLTVSNAGAGTSVRVTFLPIA